MPMANSIRKRSRRRGGGIAVQELRGRLEAFSREDEKRRQEIEKAKDLFLWRLRPIIGFVQDMENDPIVKILKTMGDFIPLDKSLIDMVAAKLAEEANLAHRLLLEEEIKGTKDIQEFWKMPIWRTYHLESFRTRIGQIGSGKIQFVLWVDKTINREALELIDEIHEKTPEFLD